MRWWLPHVSIVHIAAKDQLDCQAYQVELLQGRPQTPPSLHRGSVLDIDDLAHAMRYAETYQAYCNIHARLKGVLPQCPNACVGAHQEREQDAQAQHQPDRDSVLNISGEDAFMRRGRCNTFEIQLSLAMPWLRLLTTSQISHLSDVLKPRENKPLARDTMQ